LAKCATIFFWHTRIQIDYLRAFVAFDAFFRGGKIGSRSSNLNILTSKARKNSFAIA
jgi:hypothetical protein